MSRPWERLHLAIMAVFVWGAGAVLYLAHRVAGAFRLERVFDVVWGAMLIAAGLVALAVAGAICLGVVALAVVVIRWIGG